MSVKISLAQFGATEDKAQNLFALSNFSTQAAQQGAAMLFAPEYSMIHLRRDAQYVREAEPLDGSFVSALQELALKNRLWIAAGICEQAPDELLPFNTVVLIRADGSLAGAYRKRRLFCSERFSECALFTPGQQPFAPIDTPVGRLGMLTCFELRFSDLAQQQISAGAQALYYPAGWVAGAHKALQWQTLLAARAIEYHVPVIGVDQYLPRVFVGQSAVYLPTGELCAPPLTGEGLQTVTLDAPPQAT